VKRSLVLTSLLIPLCGLAQPSRDAPPTVDVNIVGPLPVPVDVGSTPIPVDVGPAPATEPLQLALSFDYIEAGQSGRSFFVDVPDGKLAIVDQVSLAAELPVGQIALGTVACQGVGLSSFDIPMTLLGTFSGMDHYAASLPLRCYARGTGSIVGSITRDNSLNYSGEIRFSFSAHLEDLPDVP
jgi:hypothetical protein